MEIGYDAGRLAEKFSGQAASAGTGTTTTTTTTTNNNDSLFQVMKAVETIEATIKQQVEENTRLRNELHQKILELDRLVEENTRLRNELHQKILELDRLKADESVAQRPHSVEHEEDIMQLRKHLADYSVKEAHIRNEKYILEKQIAYMRLAFGQQQQDLVDAASKALSYRQDVIEENYALQDAQQERSTFVTYLLPLLAEYSLQPPVPDAQSIVSNVKVLFKHLQEKLLTESKLKESQYRSDMNHSNFAPQSPVPQPPYSQPVSSSDAQTATDWELSSRHQIGLGGVAARNLEPDDLVRYPPLTSSSTNDGKSDCAVENFFTKCSELKSSFVESFGLEYIKFLRTASKKNLRKIKGIGAAHAGNILKCRQSEVFKEIKSLKDLKKGLKLTDKQVHVMVRSAIGNLF